MRRPGQILLAAAVFFAPLFAPGIGIATGFARAEQPHRPTLPPDTVQNTRTQPYQRPRVGVVLSGGGAKGVAHIGALRVIERSGIPIDILVGTSMGAIVGGLYSIGYTPDQLDNMVMSQDWGVLLSDRTPRPDQPYSEKETSDRYLITYPFGRGATGVSGLVNGTNLEMLFNDMTVGHHDSLDFRQLPIPFACVASNLVDGTAVVMDNGVLPTAMRASMAIPGFFTPVYEDNMVLVDGGLVNNFPTDVAHAMGADVIIGVDVQAGLKSADDLQNAAQVARQIVELNMQWQNYHEKVADADVYIKVDVRGYSSQDFNLPALDTLINRGYAAALAQEENLNELRRQLENQASAVGDKLPRPTTRTPFVPLSERGFFNVYNINFEELNDRQQKWVMRKCRIRPHSRMTIARLNHCMSILGAATSHTNIYYSLRDTLDGFNLNFHMDAVKGNSLSAGVNFDTEEISSVLVNGTFRPGQGAMEASISGRFGRRLALGANLTLLASPLSGFKFNYTFNHDDININEGGQRLFNPIYTRHLGSISFINMNFLRQNMRMELGSAFERYNFLSVLGDYRKYEDNPLEEINTAQFWSYFARLDYETIDSRYFTYRGSALSLDLELFTDNFYQWRGAGPIPALSASWTTAVPLTNRFSIIGGAYGRIIAGEAGGGSAVTRGIPFPLRNFVGGKFFGRYMAHQMPFDGIGYMETAPNIFLAAKIQARQRLYRHHHVSASFNYGIGAAEFSALTPELGRNYFGASLDYGYDLRGFPLSVSLNWSNITHSVGFYFQAGYMF